MFYNMFSGILDKKTAQIVKENEEPIEQNADKHQCHGCKDVWDALFKFFDDVFFEGKRLVFFFVFARLTERAVVWCAVVVCIVVTGILPCVERIVVVGPRVVYRVVVVFAVVCHVVVCFVSANIGNVFEKSKKRVMETVDKMKAKRKKLEQYSAM